MSVKERLRAFIQYKGMRESAFNRSIGEGQTFISSMVDSTRSDKLYKIIVQYPELNLYWLLVGEGEMIRNDAPKLESQPLNNYTMMTNENLFQQLLDAKDEILRLTKENSELKRRLDRFGENLDEGKNTMAG